MSFFESLSSREEAGWDVFGGTPNTASETLALPEIYCMDTLGWRGCFRFPMLPRLAKTAKGDTVSES